MKKILFLILCLIFANCGPSDEEIQTIVENAVKEAVSDLSTTSSSSSTSSTTTTTSTTTSTTTTIPIVIVEIDGEELEYTQIEVDDGTVERDIERNNNLEEFGCDMTDAQIERGDCDIEIIGSCIKTLFHFFFNFL